MFFFLKGLFSLVGRNTRDFTGGASRCFNLPREKNLLNAQIMLLWQQFVKPIAIAYTIIDFFRKPIIALGVAHLPTHPQAHTDENNRWCDGRTRNLRLASPILRFSIRCYRRSIHAISIVSKPLRM